MYQPRTKPRAHQVEAARRIAQRPSDPSDADVFALLMEMGTGKSKVICDEFGERELSGNLRNLIVIGPAGAYGNWSRVDDEDPGEFQKHLSDDLFSRLRVVKWQSGKRKAKEAIQHMLRMDDGRPRALVVNIEALSVESTGAREVCRALCAAGPTMVVVDESTGIKSSSSQRTKAVKDIGRLAVARRMATGLVAPKSPADLFSQYEFLDPAIIGIKSFFMFKKRYAIEREVEKGGRRFKFVAGWRDGTAEELAAKIAPYSYRVLKEDCLDLDPKIYEARDVSLTPEQLRMYVELRKYATTSMDGRMYVTATQVITQILRMHQILCGHVVDEEGVEHDVPERRTDVLMDVLADHSGKAIIWTAYRRCVEKVVKRLGEEYGPDSVAAYWGGNKRTRDEEELSFKRDARRRFMVATPDAGGKGNTWVCANLVVYHSSSHDLEKRMQSEDRAHRDGQKDQVTYLDLIARGTVEEKIIKALRKKIDISTIINGDTYREWLI